MTIRLHRLILSIAPALYLGHSAQAGDLRISPTLDIGVYQTHVSSPQPELERADTVILGELNTRIDYDSKYYLSNFEHNILASRYSDSDDSSVHTNRFNLDHQLRFLDNRLRFGHRWYQYDELLDSAKGSFFDDVYRYDALTERHGHTFDARYELSPRSPTQGNIHIEHSLTGIDPKGEGSAVQRSSKMNEDQVEMTLWRSRAENSLFWDFNAHAVNQGFDDKPSLRNYGGTANFRAPFWEQLHFAARADYSGYQGHVTSDHSRENFEVNTFAKGVGLAWVQSQKDAYIQFTFDQVEDRSGNTSNTWGLQSTWVFADSWQLDLFKSRRFYGDTYRVSFAYNGEHQRWALSHDEDVMVQYIAIPTEQVNGLYVCTPGDDPMNGIDPERCSILGSGDITLLPGQTLVKDSDVVYPLEPRLSRYAQNGLNWDFATEKWQHKLKLFYRVDETVIERKEQKRYEADFEGDWWMNSTSYFRIQARYREMNFDNKEFDNQEFLGSLGYHRELNSKAEFAITLQHITKRSWEDNYNYNDNRVMLNYTHYFGKRHRDKRDPRSRASRGNLDK